MFHLHLVRFELWRPDDKPSILFDIGEKCHMTHLKKLINYVQTQARLLFLLFVGVVWLFTRVYISMLFVHLRSNFLFSFLFVIFE